MKVIILKMKKIKREKRNRTWPTHKGKKETTILRAKDENWKNWKKWKGSAAIKLKN